jgi:ubiquinone/menaquinone biosynthesis C-methylase UbiE
MTDRIIFDDGAAYEQYMGKWSQLAGEQFLAWLAPKPALRWLDVGCGNGAFTEMLVERCAPVAVDGVDPSEAQLAYARTRNIAHVAKFHSGDAMALPFADDAFDAAVMPLVIFFVPDPARGVAEMSRVVRAGGIVAAYGWDLEGGGFPYESLREELRAMNVAVPQPPSPDASAIANLQNLWSGAGLTEIETRVITVQRTFADFDDYWQTILGGPSVRRSTSTMTAQNLALLKSRMRDRMPADAAGHITYSARANAVKGRVSLK